MMMQQRHYDILFMIYVTITSICDSYHLFSRSITVQKKGTFLEGGWRHNNNNNHPLLMSLTTTDLKGFDKFVRMNPLSDKFSSRKFHHLEFYTGEATSTYTRFMLSLGLNLIAKSDFSTGNNQHASYLLESGDVRMVFTTPYAITNGTVLDTKNNPTFQHDVANNFISRHALGVRAIAIDVPDVTAAYNTIINNGGKAVLSPTKIEDKEGRGYAEIAEISLYGDVVLRLVNTDHFQGKFLPNYSDEKIIFNERNFGIQRYDHIVGNVWSLQSQADYMKTITGFHEFAEFVAEDVGTVDSGLNSVVLANNNEYILLPINEPTYGTKRKSQIQTYLEQNLGEGVQHIALFTNNVFDTLKKMKAAADYGIGFSFMDPPSPAYYEKVKERIQPFPLNEEQFQFAKDIGLLIDKDDQGILLQIFTKPVGDRPTLFLEIIQRVGCEDEKGKQKPGCGGFGKGNFKDLFKGVEEYEKSLGIN